MKKHIPNFITCANLITGCVGIYYAYQYKLLGAFYAVLIAAVFDFLDGFVARLLRTHSDVGKELDSLADVVSFGVLPGVIVQQLLITSGAREIWAGLPFIAFMIPAFSAWRLAHFNLDTRQTDSFIGVPTPANAILIASLYPAFYFSNESLIIGAYFLQLPVLLTITVGMSLLLVSELPLFSLKFKHFTWQGNQQKFIFLSISALMILFLGVIGITFSICFYIALSVILYFVKR